MDGEAVVVDLGVDFHNDDATGFIWQCGMPLVTRERGRLRDGPGR
jgi:hypothetical protein